MAKLNDARRSLLRAKESEQSRLTQLDSERREIRASLKSLDAALRILGESKQVGPGKKPTATTTEVTDLIIEILSDVGTRSTDQLIELVGERLVRIGKSRSGLKLKLEQAMKDERLHETESGYEYRSASDSSAQASLDVPFET